MKESVCVRSRRLLLLVALLGCAAPPASPEPVPVHEPSVAVRRDARVLEAVAEVDSGDELGWPSGTPLRFVQLEVVALEVDDSSLATIGVVVSSVGAGALELMTLTGAQLDTIHRPLREEFRRPLRLDPVVAVPDGQPVRFAVASGDLALELTPRLRWDEREVDLDLVVDHAGERASARARLADGCAALLRVPGRDGHRWALVTAKLFSLEEEDLRRFNVDRD